MLGFVTLSDLLLNDLGIWNRFFGLEDRRLVIAHEIAHQWWGDQVGWTSYRDQWISEAMASYSGPTLTARTALKNDLSGVDLTSGWQERADLLPADGRAIESLGPVVLGGRLFSSLSRDAYQVHRLQEGGRGPGHAGAGAGRGELPQGPAAGVKVSTGKSDLHRGPLLADRAGSPRPSSTPSPSSSSTAPACRRCSTATGSRRRGRAGWSRAQARQRRPTTSATRWCGRAAAPWTCRQRRSSRSTSGTPRWWCPWRSRSTTRSRGRARGKTAPTRPSVGTSC